MRIINNTGYLSSDVLENADSQGYFTTTEDDQIINFVPKKFTLSAIRIFAKDTPLNVQVGEYGVLHIKPFEMEGSQLLNKTYKKL